ncbi:HesA/MoeB/ThiF family protein [Thalassomonas sp. M1454]|uniref:HesA/MoeB/ThiF family protein n=1 Tax=Thalassomonas sp. M1454 TaxID=2594477 RepID=UPI00117BF04B|nr:HesA/MoeB/ThiF family protein [Thalassomonas sp. M1454]TRX53824.1 HesA/MoeB/ThiF family protein [Thalassomonas sp. M1454]
MLTSNEQLRYSRQLLLKGFSETEQLQLKQAKVLVVGLGGLGNPVAMYLAAAGVGQLILADGDSIDITNLQRQVMFHSAQVGKNKAEIAKEHLTNLNPEIDIEVIDEMLDFEQLDYYASEVDLIIDCTDNLSARYAINLACVNHKTPLISGAAIRFEGQLYIVDPRVDNYTCYECFYPKDKGEPALNCSTAGVLGPVLGVIGSMQALEAIKLLTNKPVSTNKIKIFDGLSGHWQEFNISKRTNCICKS